MPTLQKSHEMKNVPIALRRRQYSNSMVFRHSFLQMQKDSGRCLATLTCTNYEQLIFEANDWCAKKLTTFLARAVF
jgi:hypothetical protein